MTDKNPYRTLHARMSPPGAAWDEGFAAGRAAAHPDPPDMTNMCEGESPDHKPGITPAASPDERLREALTALVALKDGPRDDNYRAAKDGAWTEARAALAAADREKPDLPPGVRCRPGFAPPVPDDPKETTT